VPSPIWTRSSASSAPVRTRGGEDGLVQRFGLSDEQPRHRRPAPPHLTALERHKIEEEHRDLLERIAYLEGLLGSEGLIYDVIKEELSEIKEMYATTAVPRSCLED